MAITKSTGTTPTERLLADLCERSFLRLWSYPNPYREDHEELCDLLVVFGGYVILFFDREGRQFSKVNADPLLSWTRWKRRVVDAQIGTAYKHERYLRKGGRVFLDPKLTTQLPLNIPVDGMKVHKIVVAHGAMEACESFSSDNVSGSLAVSYGRRSEGPDFPFMVHLEKENPVHVLDSHTLPIILGELDTFSDLIDYLDAKTEAIKSLDTLVYCGEEDLLAHYFLNFDAERNKHFIGTRKEGVNGVFIGEGEWKDFIVRPEYARKKVADQSSYLWDEIIQRTCEHALNGTLVSSGNPFRDRSAIYEMAREPRFSRRAVSDAMTAAIRGFPDLPGGFSRNVTFMPSYFDDVGFVFLQLRIKDIRDYEREYRPKRRAMLEIACGAAKNRFPHLSTIVGIAIDAPKFSRTNSEDFLLLDCSTWSDEQRNEYQTANQELRFFEESTLQIQQLRVQNFPEE